MSAKNLCDTYGFGSYQTAWGWLHKLRCVMVRTDRERLLGRVEVDEAFVGGAKEGSRGCGAEGKTAVLVAVEGESGKKLGRVRFRCVASIDRKSAESSIVDYVEPGALVVTDGLSVYDHFQALGIVHRPHVVSTRGQGNTPGTRPCSSYHFSTQALAGRHPSRRRHSFAPPSLPQRIFFSIHPSAIPTPGETFPSAHAAGRDHASAQSEIVVCAKATRCGGHLSQSATRIDKCAREFVEV